MSLLRQTLVVTGMNVRGLFARRSASAVVIVGVACAVAVMLGLLGLGEGVRRAMGNPGDERKVIVLSAGAPTEYMGSLTSSDAAVISAAPGIARARDGFPLVQPWAAVLVRLSTRNGSDSNLMLRGTGAKDIEIRGKSFHLVAGRMFSAGLHEVLVGQAVQRRFRGLELGRWISLNGSDWRIVGVFTDGGGVAESALLADADTVVAAFQRRGYQSVVLQLNRLGDFQRLKDALVTDPRLNVDVRPLTAYNRDQTRQLVSVLRFVAFFITGVMGVGVLFGAITTSSSAVEARAREIATLRALGYRGSAVVSGVILESQALALCGATLGLGIGCVLFAGDQMALGGLSFAVAVDVKMAIAAVLVALLLGFVGGLPPALRAAQRPVTEGLRAL